MSDHAVNTTMASQLDNTRYIIIAYCLKFCYRALLSKNFFVILFSPLIYVGIYDIMKSIANFYLKPTKYN